MIIRLKKQKLYEVRSHRTGRLMGTYTSRKKAEQRLRAIKYFGSLK